MITTPSRLERRLPRTNSPPSARPGFTLTEMLIVIVISAVLSAIAIPLIRGGIRTSHRTACLSNLRQIGVGLESWIQDHNQTMPVLAQGRRSREEDIPVLETILQPYLGNSTVFHCPADDEIYGQTGSSYLWNTTQNGLRRSELEFLGQKDDLTRIPLVADKEAWHPGGDAGTNFLYADLSASNRIQFAPSP